MIQVRNVPPRLHQELVRRARARGQTLTAYIQEILEREVETPDRREVLRRLYAREPVKIEGSLAEIIREGREAGSGEGREAASSDDREDSAS